MKKLFIYIPLWILLGCNSTREKELELKEREIALREKELELNQKKENHTTSPSISSQAEQSVTKFLYVLIQTKEPEVKLVEMSERLKELERGLTDSDTRPTYYASYTEYTYKSDITRIDNYSEDEKYIALENFEKEVNRSLYLVDMRAKSLWNFPGYKYETSIPPQSSILSKEAFVFDTYKEASEDKSKR